MSNKIIIAGGGTGGHIFPAVAIANAIKQLQPNAEILFIGAKGKMEMEKVPQAGYEIKGLDIAGYNRSSFIKNISLPFKIIASFIQVRSIFKSFKPQAVIGVGGYSTFPVLKYAQQKNIPTFIHESNSFAGKANMMLGRRAYKIFTASAGMEKFFPAQRIMVTGNPVRKEIVNDTVSNKEALQFFGLGNDKKTVLAIGGSLGARSINNALANNIDAFANNDLQLIWQTGKQTASDFLSLARDKKNVVISEFIKNMDQAYAAANVIISRAGAMAVAEICVVKKPAVLVPFPFAAEDHQTENAMYLVNKNAALMIKDSEVNEKLVDTIITLAKDDYHQTTLKNNIAPLAVTNADEVIANEILKAINN